MELHQQHQPKQRLGWRHCYLCHGEGNSLEEKENPLLHVCNCPSKGLVHYNCHGQWMVTSGLISCPDCGASFAETSSGRGGIRFYTTAKGPVDYVRDDPEARAALITVASMLVSMLLALVTLFRTFTVDWVTVIGPELGSLQLPVSKEGLKALLRVLLLLNVKFVVPILSVYMTTTKAVEFVQAYRIWRQTHFNVLVLPYRGARHPDEAETPGSTKS